MQDEGYGNLQGKVGFVYGSFLIVVAIWVTLVLPEMKDRALEELDEMFAKGVGTFRFGAYQTEGLGAKTIGVERAEVGAAESMKDVCGVDVKAGRD